MGDHPAAESRPPGTCRSRFDHVVMRGLERDVRGGTRRRARWRSTWRGASARDSRRRWASGSSRSRRRSCWRAPYASPTSRAPRARGRRLAVDRGARDDRRGAGAPSRPGGERALGADTRARGASLGRVEHRGVPGLPAAAATGPQPRDARGGRGHRCGRAGARYAADLRPRRALDVRRRGVGRLTCAPRDAASTRPSPASDADRSCRGALERHGVRDVAAHRAPCAASASASFGRTTPGRRAGAGAHAFACSARLRSALHDRRGGSQALQARLSAVMRSAMLGA